MFRIMILLMISFQSFLCNDVLKKDLYNKEGKEMEQQISYQIISKWLNLRELKLIDFTSKKVIKLENNGYEKLKNLTRIYFENENEDIKIYFFDNKKKCVMIYIQDKDIFREVCFKEIIEKFGHAQEIVRSRADKRANHHIYSKNGFAFSELDDRIVFFEVFPDCSLTAYKENIYSEPLLFRK